MVKTKFKKTEMGTIPEDWKVGENYLEYFGLAGSSDYDKKSELKRKLSLRYGINLIELYEKDISNLDKKLGFLMNKENIKRMECKE